MRVTIQQAAAVLERKTRALERRLIEARREQAQETLAEARRLSSGPLSTRTLRAMGHPYARARPRPPMPPHLIHRQTGRFYAGWRVEERGEQTRVVNDAPHARFMTARGTSRMIGRPIATTVAARMRLPWRRRVEDAIRKGLSAR